MKKLWLGYITLITFLFPWNRSFAADIGCFMPVQTEDLNRKEMILPKDLPAERTLLLIAFQREQQENIDTWVEGMGLKQADLPWLELPVIENPGMLGRWFINSGMRRGIEDEKSRSHVVSIYTEKAWFLSALDIQDQSAVYAVVADRKGNVLTVVKGDYSAAAAQKLLQALNS